MKIAFLFVLSLLQFSSVASFAPNARRLQQSAVSDFRRSSLKSSSSSSAEGDDLEGDLNPSSSSRYSNTTTTTAAPQAKVMKKKKRGGRGYKVLDNRDNLPFVVKLATPDPYTKSEFQKERARKNTEMDRKKNTKSKAKNKAPRYTNLKVGGVAASIFEQDDDSGELLPIIGEFQLDKSTTSGDIVLVGEQTYQVQKARCQYKYTGGQRFEMIRKILEVKPVQRVAEEAVLQRSLRKSAVVEEPPMLE